MNIRYLKGKLAGVVVSGMLWPGAMGLAQTLPAPGPVQPATASVPAVELSPGGQQVLQLHQARIGDDTIIAFIHNSGLNYKLDANAIIYLGQQGVSSPVLSAMLNQPAADAALHLPATPAPAPVAMTAYPPAYTAPAAYTAPPVTVIQTAPDPVNYDAPYYTDPYNYGYYPSVGLYFGGGWGGGYYGGGGYRGGYYGGGYHGGGGGFHGGGGGGGHGGGGGGGHGGGGGGHR